MKKTLGILVAFAAIAGFIASCKKDKTNEELNKQNATPITYVTDFNYELFGIAHNEYLKNVFAPNVGDISPKQIYDIGQSYMDPVFGSFNIGKTHSEFTTTFNTISAWSDQVLNGSFAASTLIESNHAPEEMEDFLNKLSDAFQNAGDNSMTPSEFTSEIEILNSWVRENYTPRITSDFKGNSAAAMLAMSSIAKHSYAYWYEYLGVANANIQERNLLQKAWRAIKIGVCDALGFLGGGIGDAREDHEGNPIFNMDSALFYGSIASASAAQ